MSSTSTVAKHEFKSAFLYNVTQHNIRIPKLYSLYTIEGLTYFPSNSGKILELKNLTSIVDLQSEEKIFTPKDSQLYSDSEGCFLITCQNFLMSSYLQEHSSSVNTRSSLIPFKAFPFHDIKCRDTRLNTKFNYTNTEINPTIISQESSNMNCKARTCRILNLDQQETDKSQYWCNHTVSLKHIPEGESNILDSEDIIGPSSQPYNNQQPQSFPAPETNIWPRPAIQQLPIPNEDQDEPPIDQIIGDLPNLRIPRSNDLPPSMSKHHYNSLLFLSRLLQSKDNLSSKHRKARWVSPNQIYSRFCLA